MASGLEVGGALLGIVFVMALPYLLLLIAFWRMGTGLKAIARGIRDVVDTLEGPDNDLSAREATAAIAEAIRGLAPPAK